MSENITEKFIEALHDLESNGDSKNIVALHSDDCEIGNVETIDHSDGKMSPQKFWENYRATFGEVSSKFHNKIIGENASALEWTTTGTSNDGQQINYEGVSILEFEGDRIKRFFAYFNPGKLGKQIKEQASGG